LTSTVFNLLLVDDHITINNITHRITKEDIIALIVAFVIIFVFLMYFVIVGSPNSPRENPSYINYMNYQKNKIEDKDFKLVKDEI